MTLDEVVLAELESARDRLEALEHQAYDARATFHQAVRRLHNAGGSMREIATALAMSHQRVHQIIGEDAIVEVEASSTEVTPHPAATTAATAATEASVAMTATEDVCSFCGAPRRELDKLLAAPGRVFVCSSCVGLARTGLAPHAREGDHSDDLESCDFCGNPATEFYKDNNTVICSNCVATCERVLSTDDPKRPAMRRWGKVRCSFCNTSQREISHIIAGPGVYICSACVPVAQGVASTGTAAPGPRSLTMRPATDEPHACQFCGKRVPNVAAMVKGGRARICNECIALCGEILEERLEV